MMKYLLVLIFIQSINSEYENICELKTPTQKYCNAKKEAKIQSRTLADTGGYFTNIHLIFLSKIFFNWFFKMYRPTFRNFGSRISNFAKNKHKKPSRGQRKKPSVVHIVIITYAVFDYLSHVAIF